MLAGTPAGDRRGRKSADDEQAYRAIAGELRVSQLRTAGDACQLMPATFVIETTLTVITAPARNLNNCHTTISSEETEELISLQF